MLAGVGGVATAARGMGNANEVVTSVVGAGTVRFGMGRTVGGRMAMVAPTPANTRTRSATSAYVTAEDEGIPNGLGDSLRKD